MKLTITSIFVTFLLAACSSSPCYVDYYFNSFAGKTESEVVQAFGIPAKKYDADGKSFLEWSGEREVGLFDSHDSRKPIVSWYGDTEYQYFKGYNLSFIVEKGKIVGVKWHGYKCDDVPSSWLAANKAKIDALEKAKK